MQDLKIFVSVGGSANDKQESFIQAVENRLKIENLNPVTVGRNNFSSDSPLKAVMECMNESLGAIIIAFERTYFPTGIEKRGGPKEQSLINTKYTTPWNQIEAALAYSKGLPIMVIVEEGIKDEGLLEKGYDWYVMRVKLEPATLNSLEFNGVLSSWKKKVEVFRHKNSKNIIKKDPSELTIGEIFTSLKVSQLWAVSAAIVTLFIGTLTVGALFGESIIKLFK